MILIKNSIYVIVLFFLFSCKKEKLTGEFSGLVGKWKWLKTLDNNGSLFIIGSNRVVEFKEKGIYVIKNNNRYSSRGRILKEKNYLVFTKMSTDKNRTDAVSLKKINSDRIKGDTLFLIDKDTSNVPFYIDIYIKN